MTKFLTLDNDVYYGRMVRVGLATALLFTILAFLIIRNIAPPPQRLALPISSMIELIPATLDMTVPPQTRPVRLPVAAANPNAVQANTIEPTNIAEPLRPVTQVDLTPVPFWKVEIKPVVQKVVEPGYPDVCRQAGIEGQAVVQVLVDVNGTVAEAKILKSSGNEALDDAALTAARQFIFTPARQRDRNVRVWVSIPFRFELN